MGRPKKSTNNTECKNCVELQSDNTLLRGQVLSLREELDREKKKHVKMFKRLQETENNLNG